MAEGFFVSTLKPQSLDENHRLILLLAAVTRMITAIAPILVLSSSLLGISGKLNTP